MPLCFPGSDAGPKDEARDPLLFTFRDGKRTLPPYMAALMSSFDTTRFTYDQAVAEMNRRNTASFIGASVDRLIQSHFKEGPR